LSHLDGYAVPRREDHRLVVHIGALEVRRAEGRQLRDDLVAVRNQHVEDQRVGERGLDVEVEAAVLPRGHRGRRHQSVAVLHEHRGMGRHGSGAAEDPGLTGGVRRHEEDPRQIHVLGEEQAQRREGRSHRAIQRVALEVVDA
jgi:hypothetical protein